MLKDNSEKGLFNRINRGPNRGRLYFTSLAIAISLLISCAAKAELILNGSTIYSDLGRDQFVAALYTETAHNSPLVIQTLDSEKRMEVRMLNNYSKRRWINLWMQSISMNNSRENFSESAEELIALMQAPKSAPQKGDVLEYLFTPQSGTSMRFNGTELISDLSGEVFGLLLRTWIGAIPPSTGFKEELLGNQRNPQARDLLESLTPDKQRVALAASWILPAPVKEVAKPAAPKIAAAPVTVAKVKALAVPELELPPVDTAEKNEQPVKTAPSKEAKIAEPEEPSAANTAKVAATETSGSDQALSEQTGPETNAEESEEDVDFNVVEALAQRDYTPLVVQKIYQNISYPSRAVSKNQQGTVRVAIKIGRSGELQSALTTQESRHSSLNKAALKAVEKAAPFPTLPEQITADSFELSIPITFRLQ
jgi:TonB family protein